MSDTKFKWIVSAIVIVVISVTLIVRLTPTEKARKSSPVVGEYVYIDNIDFVHVDRKCKKLNYKGLRSKRVPVDEADLRGLNYCPYCVSDEDYIILNNRRR